MSYLSGVKLYYSSSADESNQIALLGDEFKHSVNVMRHSVGDDIYVTNGRGEIFLTKVDEIKKDFLTASIEKIYKYKNEFSHITFCIPKLKSNDRLEFALEKCTELGITNFIIFDSERALHKSDKLDRWQKIVLSAMKQSLRSYLPKIDVLNSLDEIFKLDGRNILLDQDAERKISELKTYPKEKYLFIFGPEGGFTKEEINLFGEKYKLANNRLRTETAIIKCASIIME
jgi:16S rRNA (uracil1498-N3)-methyltransferase